MNSKQSSIAAPQHRSIATSQHRNIATEQQSSRAASMEINGPRFPIVMELSQRRTESAMQPLLLVCTRHLVGAYFAVLLAAEMLQRLA